jgi:hypothetical protein
MSKRHFTEIVRHYEEHTPEWYQQQSYIQLVAIKRYLLFFVVLTVLGILWTLYTLSVL